MVGFCCFYNTVNDCGSLGSIDCIYHLPVFLPDTKSPDCPFGCIVIYWNISICEKYSKIFFLVQRVSDGISKFILSGYFYGFQVRKKASTSGFITTCRCLSRSSEERSFSFPLPDRLPGSVSSVETLRIPFDAIC